MNLHNDPRNLTMLTDFYELTMSNGYFEEGMGDRIAVFDMFFRTIPDGGGFAIAAGLEQLVQYFNNLHFTCGRGGCFPSNFWSICGISSSSATYGR